MHPAPDTREPPPRVEDHDPAWYGGLSHHELSALLGRLLAGERARLAHTDGDPAAGGHCPMLYRHWRRLCGAAPPPDAPPDSPADSPAAPPQAVVQQLVSELHSALPQVFDDALHGDLAAMLAKLERQCP